MHRIIVIAIASLLAFCASAAQAQQPASPWPAPVKERPSLAQATTGQAKERTPLSKLQGQQNGVQMRAPIVPAEFAKLLDIYRDWTPETKEEPLASSVFNWWLHPHLEADDPATVSKASAWLFSLSEARFKSLASASASTLRTVFGPAYQSRNVSTILSRPYNADADAAYTAWYGCMAKLSDVGEDRVLAGINWNYGNVTGEKNECQESFAALSEKYGVSELSVDELTVVGFFHRRFAANAKDKKMLPAEVIRQAMHEVFDSE